MLQAISFATNGGEIDENEAEIDACELLLAKYSLRFPSQPDNDRPKANTAGQTILITGTTGRLGTQLLRTLQSLDSVKSIICLNRAADGGLEQQWTAAAANGFDLDMDKAAFLCADYTKPRLGLSDDDYNRLLATTDRIIHNAWHLSFSQPVRHFESCIKGTRQLIDLAAAATKRIPLTFISSLITIARWTSPEPVPETALADFQLAATGYGQSKLVANMLMQRAADDCAIPVTIIRIGQIAGPLSELGTWGNEEWLPKIIASSVVLNALPSRLGPLTDVDWLPVETVSEAIVEISDIAEGKPQDDQCQVYNLCNPNTIAWMELTTAICDYYAQHGRRIDMVSLPEWIARVCKSPEPPSRNPAVLLVDLLQALASLDQVNYRHAGFSTTKAAEASPALRNLGRITPDMMKRWCSQWSFESR